MGARLDYPVEARRVDRLPRVGSLDIRTIGKISSLPALDAVDPREYTHHDLRPSARIHWYGVAGHSRNVHDGVERMVVMIEKTEGCVNRRRLIVVHIP